MLVTILLIIVGFGLLILGADLLVRGSSNIAKRFHISEMIIGLTIVSIGTSLPELMITISSAQKGATDLIIGNAVGSNICNLLLILGITAYLRPIELEKDVKIVHLPVALISTIAILVMGIGLLGSEKGIISRIDGQVLILLYIIYFIYPIMIEVIDIYKTGKEKKGKHAKRPTSILLSMFFIIIGAIFLKYGGDLVVDEASKLAELFGISERVIGLTIVSIGTSLPELITSVVAIVKKEGGLAVGNLVGSCILNALLIVGVGALITPLVFSNEFIGNLLLLAGSIIFIWILCFIGKKDTITRYEAGALLLIYVVYMWRLFI